MAALCTSLHHRREKSARFHSRNPPGFGRQRGMSFREQNGGATGLRQTRDGL